MARTSGSDTAVVITPFELRDAAELRAALLASWDHLQPWMPRRDRIWFTLAQRRRELEHDVAQHAAGAGFHFAVRVDGELVGSVSLTNVVRGAWHNANIGYWIGAGHTGRGYATAAVGQAVRFAFTAANLHRVQAAVMPRNAGSLRVLEKNGFRREGLAERYLCINGSWEDHVILAVTADRYPAIAG